MIPLPNLEICIRFNADKKSISKPKPVKSLDSPSPGSLGKPMNILLKFIPCLFKKMDNWRIIRLSALRKELHDLEKVISKINLDGIYINGGSIHS